MEDWLITLCTYSLLLKCLWNRTGHIQYNPGYLCHEENLSQFIEVVVKRPSVMRANFVEIGHSDDPDKPSYMSVWSWIFLGVSNKTLLKCCLSKIRPWVIFHVPYGVCHVKGEYVTSPKCHPFAVFCKITLAAFGSKDCLHHHVWNFCFCNWNNHKALLLPSIQQIIIFHTYLEMICAHTSWHSGTYHENVDFVPMGRKTDIGQILVVWLSTILSKG